METVSLAIISSSQIKENSGKILPLLSAEEKARAQRFVREKDKLLSLGGAYLCRRRYGTNAVITRTPRGKPRVKGSFFSVSHSEDLIMNSEEMEKAFIFFYDREYGNIVYMIDAASDNSLTYHFPCSIEKPGELILSNVLNDGEAAPYYNDKTCFSATGIRDGEGNIYAYVAYELTNERIASGNTWFALSTFFIILAATLVLSFFYLLFADKLIVRNVKKLTSATESFTSGLGQSGTPQPSSAGVSTKDELGELSRKIDIMQETIIGHIGTIAEKKAEEEKMKAELDIAARIQRETLPSDALCSGKLKITNFLQPAKEVGGDFYDYFTLPDGRLFFYIADVSGKGVPAALFMMRSKELIKSLASTGLDLPSLAFRVNNALCDGNTEGLFITTFFGIADEKSGTLTYLRAGHEQPFLRRGGIVTRIADESNFIIGAFENMSYQSGSIPLRDGDVLLMFTDGLNEGINADEEEFGYDRITEIIGKSPAHLPERLFEALCGFACGAEQFDDVTMLCLSVKNRLDFRFEAPGYDIIPSVTNSVYGAFKGIFGDDCLGELGVIIDELLNNCVTYAFDGIDGPYIELNIESDNETVSIRLTDNGVAFDPLSYVCDSQEPGAFPQSGENIGIGIEFVKKLSDKQNYRREGGKNILEIVKILPLP